MQNCNDEEALIKNVGDSCETADYFSKLFLRPIEIMIGPDNSGLERVVWSEGAPDKFTSLPIQNVQGNLQINAETMKNQTLLSYFAASNPQHRANIRGDSNSTVKLAICVCAYSQDSEMLQKSLSGILNNYEYLQKLGVSTEEVAVVILFDGIEKMHSTVETFFTNMDRESRFLWKEYASTLQDMRESFVFDPEDINVYSKDELAQLSLELLPSKKRDYLSKIELMKMLVDLKKKKSIQYSHLPEQVQKQYITLLIAEYRKHMGLDQDDELSHKDDYYVRFFESKPQIREKCVYMAITETETLCKRFISARSKTALLYSYRLMTKSGKNTYIFMCVKHQNQGKLWSHNWFFNGFCQVMKPEQTILMDVGLTPAPDALFKMYNYLQHHPECGGVCGYMALSIEKPEYISLSDLDIFTRIGAFFFDIQKAQQFEYHFSHMLDKPFEAAFGFIHVLPGAFSGYNMNELFLNDNTILKQYFKSLNQEDKNVEVEVSKTNMLLMAILPRCFHGKQSEAYNTLKQKNIYLAEDRILCLGIHQKNLTMAYLPDAEASVDSITTLSKLLGQRKRWINGSYFAFQKVQDSWKCGDSCGFSIQMAFYVFMSYFSYISIALFFITLDLTLNTFADQVIFPAFMQFFQVDTAEKLKDFTLLGFINAYGLPASFPVILNFIYIILVGSMVLLSLNLNQTNRRFEKTFYLVAGILGWYSILMYVVLLVQLFSGQIFLETQTQTEQGSIVSPALLRIQIFVIIVIHCIPPLMFLLLKRRIKYGWEVISSSLSYLFYAPAYLHVLMIFAYCRIDDISWGTKGLTSSEEHSLSEGWATQKHIFVSRFILTNIIFGFVLKILVADIGPRSFVIFVFSLIIGISLIVKLICSIFYICRYLNSMPPQTRSKYESAQETTKISKLEQVYRRFRPLLISSLQEQYKKYITEVSQSSIIPKGLKSMMFKGAKKSIELSKLLKKDPPKFKKQLPPISQQQRAIIKKKLNEQDELSSHELNSKSENTQIELGRLGNKISGSNPNNNAINKKQVVRFNEPSSPSEEIDIKNLLGKKLGSKADDTTMIQKQKDPRGPAKFKKKYSKHEDSK